MSFCAISLVVINPIKRFEIKNKLAYNVRWYTKYRRMLDLERAVTFLVQAWLGGLLCVGCYDSRCLYTLQTPVMSLADPASLLIHLCVHNEHGWVIQSSVAEPWFLNWYLAVTIRKAKANLDLINFQLFTNLERGATRSESSRFRPRTFSINTFHKLTRSTRMRRFFPFI